MATELSSFPIDAMIPLAYARFPTDYPKVSANVAARIIEESKKAMKEGTAKLKKGSNYDTEKANLIMTTLFTARAEFEKETKRLNSFVQTIPVLKDGEHAPGLTTASSQKIVNTVGALVLGKQIPELPSETVQPLIKGTVERLESEAQQQFGAHPDYNSPAVLDFMAQGFAALVTKLLEEGEKLKAQQVAAEAELRAQAAAEAAMRAAKEAAARAAAPFQVCTVMLQKLLQSCYSSL